MPINKEAYLRYRVIDQRLRDKSSPYPSIEKIIVACEMELGKSFGARTIRRDIRTMKEDSVLAYYAPIKYSKAHEGYYYDDPDYSILSIPLNEDDIQAVVFAASVLQQYKGVSMFEQFDDAIDKILSTIDIKNILDDTDDDQLIQFEKVEENRGSGWLSFLLQAIKERQVVSFTYTKFNTDVAKKRVVHPYMLKQYRHRWYLIGMLNHNKFITTFGLDRMAEVELDNDASFEFNFKFDPKTYFSHAYGITNFNGEPKHVVLSFTPLQGAYIKTQPLHATQKILKDNDKELRIELTVGITIELIMDILKYGNNVTVIQPKELKDDIKQRLEDALGRY